MAIEAPWWASDTAEVRLRNTIAALREAAKLVGIERGDVVSVGEIECGLVETLGLNQITDILEMDVNAGWITSVLSTYDFLRLRPERLCQIELTDSIVPGGITIFVTEAKVKLQGEIWIVHKNDADPFPSNPHAHNYHLRVKMHLGNGDLYSYRTKVPSGRLSRAVLLDFRARVQRANATIRLPPLAV